MSALHSTNLAVREIVVRFGGLHAVGPISLDVRRGECVVILGPSGCGKSTLLSALAGLQEIASGQVEIGANVSPPGFVFQDPNLMPWASALENIALPLALKGKAAAQQKQAAQAALERVGLSAFGHARPRALSGGMAMRVALARALVDDPTALLLDEPFGAIDELGRRDLNDLVHRVKNERQMAVLFVTHSVEEAVYMADRIVVLSGRPGTIKAVIDVPQVARDSDFLISSSFGETVSQVRRVLGQAIKGVI